MKTNEEYIDSLIKLAKEDILRDPSVSLVPDDVLDMIVKKSVRASLRNYWAIKSSIEKTATMAKEPKYKCPKNDAIAIFYEDTLRFINKLEDDAIAIAD